jgi:hypothetical protein
MCGCEGHEPEKSRWTGEWPGVAECRELGFWCVERPHTHHPLGGCFWPCTEDYPGAREDLNRYARYRQLGRDKYEGCELLAPKGAVRRYLIIDWTHPNNERHPPHPSAFYEDGKWWADFTADDIVQLSEGYDVMLVQREGRPRIFVNRQGSAFAPRG